MLFSNKQKWNFRMSGKSLLSSWKPNLKADNKLATITKKKNHLGKYMNNLGA